MGQFALRLNQERMLSRKVLEARHLEALEKGVDLEELEKGVNLDWELVCKLLLPKMLVGVEDSLDQMVVERACSAGWASPTCVGCNIRRANSDCRDGGSFQKDNGKRRCGIEDKQSKPRRVPHFEHGAMHIEKAWAICAKGAFYKAHGGEVEFRLSICILCFRHTILTR